jgi:hypothetical protein
MANKQYYLMQIFQVEKSVEAAQRVYMEWDFLEFTIYRNSFSSMRALSE